MTVASLIVDIAANTVRLEKDVGRINNSLESMQSVAGKVGTALAGAFTVTAVVALGKQVLDVAGDIADLSQRLGVSTDTVQEWQATFGKSGVAIDAVAKASEQLSLKLSGGDKSAVGALKAMGLSIDELFQMKPEDRFVKVADAVGRLQNQDDKIAASKGLFGKGGPELLSALDGHLGDTIEQIHKMGLVIDGETITAADKFGDELGLMGKQLLGIVATVVGPLLPALSMLGNVLSWLGSNVIGPVLGFAVKALVTYFLELFRVIARFDAYLAEMATKIPIVGKYLGFMGDASKWLSEQADKADRMITGMWTATENTGQSAVKVAPALLALGTASETSAKSHEKAASAVDKQAEAMERLKDRAEAAAFAVERSVGAGLYQDNRPGTFTLNNVGWDPLGAGAARTKLPDLSGMTGSWINKLLGPSTGQDIGRYFSGGQFGKTIVAAMTGGGGMSGAMKAAGSEMGEKLTKHFGTFITDNLPGKFGQMLGGLVGPLGAIAGPLMGKIFGKLFNNPEKQVNPVRQAFIDAAGGLAALDRTAHAAGVTLDHLLDAKTPEAYKRAVDELNAALQFQDDAMKTLEETAQKYGLTIEELGPAFSRQQLEKKAGELYQDFMVLKAGGVQVDTILGRMGDSINDFVHSALKTGTEIPAAMAPMLQRMVELGQLTDENGNVITDLDAAGVHFSMTMTEGFEKVVSAVQKLTDAITRGLGTAIETIPSPHITGSVHWNVDPLPGVDTLDPNIPQMANGGIVTGPTLAMIGEGGGPEAVIPLDRLNQMRQSGVVNLSEFRAELVALRDEQARLNEYMTSQFSRDQARAIRDEVQKTAWRKRY